jgi:hypothetical protein
MICMTVAGFPTPLSSTSIGHCGVEGARPIFRHFPADAGLISSVHVRLALVPCIWADIAAKFKRLRMCSRARFA